LTFLIALEILFRGTGLRLPRVGSWYLAICSNLIGLEGKTVSVEPERALPAAIDVFLKTNVYENCKNLHLNFCRLPTEHS